MTNFTRTVLGLGLTLLLGACDDDEQSIDPTPDASAPDSSTSDGGARDADVDANLDAGIDASFVASDAGHADSGFCPSERFTDGAVAYEEYPITLTTAAEAPPCTAAGPSAVGSAKLVFYCSDPSFYVTGLGWQNLSSTVVSAHIHYGAVGTSGPIVINLEPNDTGSGNGSGSATTFQAKPGGPPTFDSFLNELRAGKAYINVHTQTCPGGEIRGQIPTH